MFRVRRTGHYAASLANESRNASWAEMSACGVASCSAVPSAAGGRPQAGSARRVPSKRNAHAVQESQTRCCNAGGASARRPLGPRLQQNARRKIRAIPLEPARASKKWRSRRRRSGPTNARLRREDAKSAQSLLSQLETKKEKQKKKKLARVRFTRRLCRCKDDPGVCCIGTWCACIVIPQLYEREIDRRALAKSGSFGSAFSARSTWSSS